MTLWMTPSLRYFLVPSSFAWPTGADVVNDVLGKARTVDLGALAPHEVSPEQARAFAEGETRRIEAELDRTPRTTPDPDALRAQVEALAARAGGLDDRVRDALAAIGLPVDRLVADPERTITMWAEIVATVSLAKDRAARERVSGRIEAILTRNGYSEAARQLRTAPTKLRKWAESMQSSTTAPHTGGEMTYKQRVTAVLGAVRGSLTAPQIAEVETNLGAGETLLALEFLVDFLREIDAAVAVDVKAEIVALADAMGSTRKGPRALRVVGAASAPPAAAPGTPKQRILAVLHATRGSLTPPQIAEVESNIIAGELVLALEFLVDFLVENDATVSPAVNTEILTLLRGYGSDRAGDGLPVA